MLTHAVGSGDDYNLVLRSQLGRLQQDFRQQAARLNLFEMK